MARVSWIRSDIASRDVTLHVTKQTIATKITSEYSMSYSRKSIFSTCNDSTTSHLLSVLQDQGESEQSASDSIYI